MTEEPPRRWAMLVLLSVAELLGMSLWFTATAAQDALAGLWGLSDTEFGWLTTVVQLGFVAGTAAAAFLNLADLVPARVYFAASALLGAGVNTLLLTAPDYRIALLLRFLTGVSLAGVYPPAMKMIATWFRSARGLAVGTVVGALVVGKATPYLIRALDDRLMVVVGVTSGGAVLSALVVAWGYRDGPYAFRRQPFSWTLASVVWRHRETRLAVTGYLGHMWELYAMWTWIPAFLAASFAVYGSTGHSGAGHSGAGYGVGWLDDFLAFGTLAVGGLGCVWGGAMADRIGRGRLVNRAMAISGACCLAVGLAYGGHPWLVAAITLVWGFFVVADSAQFSTMVTEVTPQHAVGTALTLQTSIGFLLTMATIQLVPLLVAAWGWPWAFSLLALGPALGIAAIRRLDASAGG